MADRKQQIIDLLKSIETGEPEPISVVNEAKYIQHNPQTHEGGEGLATLFKRLSKTKPRVNIVRIFEDGNFVFGHTEYHFSTRRIGFEVFRFEDDQAVEHWDNIQPRLGPNRSGNSMVDGATKVHDKNKTEVNRAHVRSFVEQTLVGGQTDRLADFIDENYIEHNPELGNGLPALKGALASDDDQKLTVNYQHLHRLLADGNFVLSVCEGEKNGKHSALYDLFRLENERIVEHWDTTEKVAPKSEWKNNNGKF